MNLIGKLHEEVVHSRRVKVLASGIAEVLPKGSNILDVGCGDGRVDDLIMKLRPDVAITGLEVLERKNASLPSIPFDGVQIPYASKTFDVVLLVDVLHHAGQPRELLAEAKRVSKEMIVLKDHTKEGFLAEGTLRFMDWIGNARHGVSLPYSYWTKKQWLETFSFLDLEIEFYTPRLGLYPFPANMLFDRSLHFIATLKHA